MGRVCGWAQCVMCNVGTMCNGKMSNAKGGWVVAQWAQWVHAWDGIRREVKRKKSFWLQRLLKGCENYCTGVAVKSCGAVESLWKSENVELSSIRWGKWKFVEKWEVELSWIRWGEAGFEWEPEREFAQSFISISILPFFISWGWKLEWGRLCWWWLVESFWCLIKKRCSMTMTMMIMTM